MMEPIAHNEYERSAILTVLNETSSDIGHFVLPTHFDLFTTLSQPPHRALKSLI